MTSCGRSAWLTLGALSLALEDTAAGYFCTSLDLGAPAIREVVDNRPDADGVLDRTLYMAARVVTAEIKAVAGAGAVVDQVAAAFGPFMVPSARPTLHYILERAGGLERTLTLRAAGYAWPIAGPYERDIQLQWVAADPIARDPAEHSATSWAGAPGGGRSYDDPYYVAHDRTYPQAGAGPSGAEVTTAGDVPVRPLLRIYGPITGATVTFTAYSDGAVSLVPLDVDYAIATGHYLEVDTAAHTVYLDGDPTQPKLSALDWPRLTWPVIAPAPDGATMELAGAPSGLVTSGVTQVQATWQDGYLS